MNIDGNGKIEKSGSVGQSQVTDAALSLINSFTLKKLTAEEVFTFKIAVCDNQIDRDFERFSDKSLSDWAKLLKGKTIISDHTPKSANQCARIFDTEIVEKSGVKKVVAHCYTIRTDSTKDFIAEIEGGIKKEVSVGGSAMSAICSICDTDNAKNYCPHMPGRVYEDKQCHFILDGIKDAYEVSFVAIPAQKNAGVTKSYGEKPYDEDKKPPKESDADDTNKGIESEIDCELQCVDAFLFTNENNI